MSKPRNLTAFAAERVRGNPPSVSPASGVENCFPGLEIDVRNLFRHLFGGLTVDASILQVIAIEDPELAQRVTPGQRIVRLDGEDVGDPIGWDRVLAGRYRLDPDDPSRGAPVVLGFDDGQSYSTRFNRLVVDGVPQHTAPGELTQSLCSPWQHDFQECGCFYWAASRPDMVTNEDGLTGQSWLRRLDHTDVRDSYKTADLADLDPEMTHRTMYRDWQRLGVVVKQAVTVDGEEQMLPVEQGRVKREDDV